jgi:exodeoxyribonuclease VII large subunit
VDANALRRIYSVSEITSAIKQSLDSFGVVWVQGELSNFKHHSSGHMYFSLKDDRAQLKAAFFRNNNMHVRFRPEDGLEVIARGRISVYEPRGDYQIIVEYMEPVGLGSLQLAFEQLKEKLRREGLFDQARKRKLPLLPGKIGIVTSPTGAALCDMLRVLQRRNASLHILIYPARVQGSGAAEEVAAGIRHFNSRDDIDVLIIGRGGGSIEDLWAFNEEILARAVYASRIPVISAVGHEVDFTISDFTADLRAPTPSAAAEMVSGVREDLRAMVSSLAQRAVQALRLELERRRARLERLAGSRAFAVAPNKVREFQQRFDEAAVRMTERMRRFITFQKHRGLVMHTRLIKLDLRRLVGLSREMLIRRQRQLSSAAGMCLHRERARVELAVGRLHALSPLAILERGYAICLDARGRVLKDATVVRIGEQVSVKLAEGDLGCVVQETRLPEGRSEPDR